MSEFCALPSHTDLCGTCRWTDEGLLPTREESTLRATVEDELTVQLAQLALQRQEDDHYHAMEVDNAQAQVDPEQQEVLANIYDVGGQGQVQPQERLFPYMNAQGQEFMQELHGLWAQHRRRRLGEQLDEQPQAQAQGQPQEMAPMVLAPQVGPLYNQEQHALAAQAVEDAVRVAPSEDPVLAHLGREMREMREKRRRLHLRETVGGMKILLGEMRTEDGHPKPYMENLTNLKMMFLGPHSELELMHALLDADGEVETAVAMLVEK